MDDPLMFLYKAVTEELEKENIKGVFCWGVNMDEVINPKESNLKTENSLEVTEEKKKIGLKTLGKQLIQAVRFRFPM